MKATFFIAALIFFANISVAQGDLELKIQNYEEDNGKIIIAVYNSADSFLKHPYKYEKLESTNESQTFRFTNLPKGNYAIKIYQDKNNDRTLNIGEYGDKEIYGFSNNQRSRIKSVSFSDIKFEVGSKELSSQIISLSK